MRLLNIFAGVPVKIHITWFFLFYIVTNLALTIEYVAHFWSRVGAVAVGGGT